MEISHEQLGTFRAIYQAKFGLELTQAEALEKATSLLALMMAICRTTTT